MPPRKQGFTFEQHVQTGLDLKVIRQHLMDITRSLSKAHPKSSRTMRLARSLMEKLDQLRSELDDTVCGDFPGESDNDCIGAYYGGDPPLGAKIEVTREPVRYMTPPKATPPETRP